MRRVENLVLADSVLKKEEMLLLGNVKVLSKYKSVNQNGALRTELLDVLRKISCFNNLLWESCFKEYMLYKVTPVICFQCCLPNCQVLL